MLFMVAIGNCGCLDPSIATGAWNLQRVFPQPGVGRKNSLQLLLERVCVRLRISFVKAEPLDILE